jgi:hypothetical protein
MSILTSHQEVIIDAPPRFCFERFADVTAYPQWEPSARQVRVIDFDPGGVPRRIEFRFEKRLLFYTCKLEYSLRSEMYERAGSYWIKFDDARGDLRSIMTVVEFAPLDSRCRMSYRGVIDDPLLLRRALVAFFGPKELQCHLERFRRYVQRTWSEQAKTCVG